MASFFNNISSRFGRGSSSRGTSPYGGSPTSPTLNTPSVPNLPANMASNVTESLSPPVPVRKPPFFFREENSNLIVKGNFMTLAAKPEHVEKGEWLAHQIVEQYRLLEGMIKVIQEVDANTKQPICNPSTCPTMSAAEFTYTWLDNNRNPIRIPAAHYITLVQRWILGKIQDPTIFPTTEPTSASIASMSAAMDAQQAQQNAAITGASFPPAANNYLSLHNSNGSDREWTGRPSGFPESFENDIKSLYRQMFRCYAHIYHGHWLEPFYHIGAYKELNTCFIHFINVGRLFDLINDKDLRPMQPLIDIWVAKGLLVNDHSTTAAVPTPASASSGYAASQSASASGA